jgi:hypothetical protein
MCPMVLPLDLHGNNHDVVYSIHSLILSLSALKNPKHELSQWVSKMVPFS